MTAVWVHYGKGGSRCWGHGQLLTWTWHLCQTVNPKLKNPYLPRLSSECWDGLHWACSSTQPYLGPQQSGPRWRPAI